MRYNWLIIFALCACVLSTQLSSTEDGIESSSNNTPDTTAAPSNGSTDSRPDISTTIEPSTVAPQTTASLDSNKGKQLVLRRQEQQRRQRRRLRRQGLRWQRQRQRERRNQRLARERNRTKARTDRVQS